MARSYRGVRPKQHHVYDIPQILQLFDITRNTATNWQKAGLRVVDDAHPILITGAELIRFHTERKITGHQSLKTGQFMCRRCGTRVYPDIETVSVPDAGRPDRSVRGECPDCKRTVRKFVNRMTCEAILACQNSNTPLLSLDEKDSPIPGHIGNPTAVTCRTWTPGNERVLYLYLKLLGQFHERTIDAIMATVRQFEAFLDGKRFDRLKPGDVSAWRDHILKRGLPGSPMALSRSTICHHASHLKHFLDWLVKQDGYRKLNGSLADYIKLPKGQSAALLQPEPAPYPTAEEAIAMVEAMPTDNLVQRRDRAIVATAFLTGLRVGSLASLRFGDIAPSEKAVRIDGRSVRAKNGKSQETFWFPVGPVLEGIVADWLKELEALGVRAGDALFPPNEALISRTTLIRNRDRPIACWKTEDGISRAFSLACQAASVRPYTPHSARHFVTALGHKICRTEEHREAWSKNLGHSKRQITVSHYAKMTPQEHKSVMARLRLGDIETEDEKDLLLAFHEHRLVRGSQEFELAERIHIARLTRIRNSSKLD